MGQRTEGKTYRRNGKRGSVCQFVSLEHTHTAGGHPFQVPVPGYVPVWQLVSARTARCNDCRQVAVRVRLQTLLPRTVCIRLPAVVARALVSLVQSAVAVVFPLLVSLTLDLSVYLSLPRVFVPFACSHRFYIPLYHLLTAGIPGLQITHSCSTLPSDCLFFIFLSISARAQH